MPRITEKDEFGCDIEYKMPKKKRCPTCRREVCQTEITYIQNQYKMHPDVNDKAY
jgi:hypothetical protein